MQTFIIGFALDSVKPEAAFPFVIIAVSSAAYEGSSSLYRHYQRLLIDHIRQFLRQQYQIELETIVVEQPPKIEFGEYAMPFSFELAKKLRKAPRKIAEEIVATIGDIPGFEKLEVAGAGYINARLKRGDVAKAVIEARAHSSQAVERARITSKPKIMPAIGVPMAAPKPAPAPACSSALR